MTAEAAAVSNEITSEAAVVLAGSSACWLGRSCGWAKRLRKASRNVSDDKVMALDTESDPLVGCSGRKCSFDISEQFVKDDWLFNKVAGTGGDYILWVDVCTS